MRHGLTDEEWNVIEDLFPSPASTGRPPADPRKMLNAMIWLANTGAKWREIPPDLSVLGRQYSSTLIDGTPTAR
jgi:transposase